MGMDGPPGRTHMTLVPTMSIDEFWLPLSSFVLTADAKDGCGSNMLIDDMLGYRSG